ncbi:MAG: prefoldin subunit alpha [Candidatus Pacearchaeota archaeon]|nr:prefoldin subunit alpha [Candidatus Pacearchaeota archaeon]
MKEELQKKALQITALDSRLQELKQHLELLEKQINELQATLMALDEIKKTELESEMLAPISPGVFVKASFKENKDIIINIGAKIFCKKNVEEAKKFIQQKLDKSLDVYNKIAIETNFIIENLASLEKEFRKLQEK